MHQKHPLFQHLPAKPAWPVTHATSSTLPLLNAFGRAFKAGGFTMMGTQAKIEGEHLEIPATLNISALVTAGLNIGSNSRLLKASPNDAANSNWFVPNGGGELSLFFGGRVSENVGFLSELAFPDGNPALSSAKLPVIFDVGGNKVGLVFTNAGPSYSMELLNTGANSAHRLMGNKGEVNAVSGGSGNHINATSAAQYLGTKGGGAGYSAVASGGWGFVNVGKYNFSMATGGGDTNALNTTYARAAATFDAAGWDTAVGVQMYSGTDGQKVLGVPGAETKATIFDAQAQGAVGEMPLGLYFSMGTAPKSNTVSGSTFNVHNATDKKSTNIAVELGVIPHVSTVQFAYRNGKNGAAAGANVDNAIMLGVTYELAQNVELSLTRTANSGNAYDANLLEPWKTQTTFLLEALF